MNSNKKTITIGSIIALIILALVIIVTFATELTGFSIILTALFIILTICLGIYLKEEPDNFTAFVKNKKRILRTYDSIIVEVEDIPNIAGKNIIKVKSIEDLVDAQLELREPIYYKNDNDSCFFMLLHYNEACIYILKMDDSVVSPTEQSIKYMKEDKETKTEDNTSILDNIEDTIVYKLDELRSFKISPVRNKKAIEVVDDTAIKHEIEENNHKVTKEELEDEISKTTYLKDLKEKIAQYEQDNNKEIEVEELPILEVPKPIKKETPVEKQPKEPSVAKETKEKKKTDSKKTTSKKTTNKKPAPKKKTHQEKRTAKYNSKK